ncbi:MAG TPA: 2-phospho-L-lactate guanylyltransferase [Candidatus Limnocylindrales bacterium]|nr:2-phospho-L-lactate guanylyltransferase [Candidatus Limnocylindrales bacterium]
MNAALVPVRSIAGGKQRLASCLDAARREALALAMLEDMLAALAAAESLDRIVVVSGDGVLLDHARRCGAEALEEGAARGLNGAVAMAARHLEAQGVRRLLTIPGDVPLIDPLEIDGMFATDPARYPVVAAPSSTATGTNALLTSPPTVIGFCFEGESLAAYRRACRQAQVEMLILCLDGFAIDVDTPADLLSLPAQGGRTCALVEEWRRLDAITAA